MTGRASKVTGDEPGTCKSVTGTPYAGAEQYGDFCPADEAASAALRTRALRSTPGPALTGQQPGVGGKMTGDRKGACEPVSGTPYVGADQFAGACPATPADTASPDFPQSLTDAPWQQFSVTSPFGWCPARTGFHGCDRQPVRAGSDHGSVRHGHRQGHRYRGGPFRARQRAGRRDASRRGPGF